MHFSTVAVPLTLALAATATPLKRQTPDRFALFFAATASEPETELLVTNECGQNTPQSQCIVTNPTTPTAPVEPLILDKDFVFTSIFGAPTGGQALILNTERNAPFALTVAHSGFLIPAGYTRDGFSIDGEVLSFAGSAVNFYQCLEFVTPGGQFPLYSPDPVTEPLAGAGCTQRQVLAKTSAVA